MTPKAYLIVEGKFDEAILKALLPQEMARQLEIVVGNGSYSAQSLARSILAVKRIPVVLVMDAETTESSAVKEREDFLQEALGQAAAGTPFKILLAEPELEVLLLMIPSLTNEATVAEKELAQLSPRKFLHLKNNEPDRKRLMNKLLKKIDAPSLEMIQKQPLIKEIIQFLSTLETRTNGQKRPAIANGSKSSRKHKVTTDL